MNYPKISLVTPSLNQGRFIEETIQSVLSQDYPNLEYLVMDGGSTDNTLDILKRYSNQLKWVSEKDTGQTNAINKGLRMASGEILAYLNADDLLLPGTFLQAPSLFMEHPQTMWITGQCRIIDEDNREIRRLITAYKNLWLHLSHPSILLITDYISQPSTFWRVNVMTELGYLDESLHYVMDYEYWLRLYSKYPPMFIPEYLAAFKIHHQSKKPGQGTKKVLIKEERQLFKRQTTSRSLLWFINFIRLLLTSPNCPLNQQSQNQ